MSHPRIPNRLPHLALCGMLLACTVESAGGTTGPAPTGDAKATAGDVAAADATGSHDGTMLDQPAAADAGADAASDLAADASASGTIAIYLLGDHQPQSFADGLQGQTASEFQVALSRYVVLKGADDPAPQPCFDHGDQPVVADLQGDKLMGLCPASAIATGLYTHGRVKVDWARYTVQGQLHYGATTLPGKFTFLRAWSDTTVAGKAYKAGTGTLRFRDVSGTVDNEVPYAYPPFPAMTGIATQTIGGEFLMTFAYQKALPVVQGAAGSYWARFHWHVWQAFRWQDSAGAAFGPGIWDVVPPPGLSETVLMAGLSGYHVSSSVD